MRLYSTLILSVLTTASLFAQDRLNDNEANYYQNNIGAGTVMATGLNGEYDGADSDRLNVIIDSLSGKGGGTIIVNHVPDKDNIYLRNVDLMDKVRLKFAPDVILRPWFGGDRPKNVFMIRLGFTAETKVRDVAVTNIEENSTDPEDYFQVELLPGGFEERVKFIEVKSAYNFKISGIRFVDDNTVFSNVEFNLNKDQSRTEGDIPTQGLVKNMVSSGNHVGYGLVQMRAGKRILFKNLDGQGGVTLRIESGFVPEIITAEATIDQIVGRGITIRDGDAAVTLSPHRVNQGKVDVSDISAYGSTVAVQLAGGFLDSKGGVDNLGTFSEESFIGGFVQVKGGENAQVKNKDVKYFPCQDQGLINSRSKNPDNESTQGPSLAVVRHGSHPSNDWVSFDGKERGLYTVNLELPTTDKVNGIALGNEKMVFYGAMDAILDCPDYIPVVLSNDPSENIKVWPNPAESLIFIDWQNSKIPIRIDLLDSSGKLILKSSTNAENKTVIDLSDIPCGTYFLVLGELRHRIVLK